MLSEMTFKVCFEELCDLFLKYAPKGNKIAGIYYKELRYKLTDKEFMNMCTHIRRNGDKLPTIKDFITLSKSYHKPPAIIASKCSLCDSSGIIKAKKEGYPYIFKCPNCSNCQAKYPEWSEDYRSNGYSPSFPITDWNEQDETQCKGLAIMGVDSRVWRRAPEVCRNNSKKYLGRKSVGNLF